MKTQKIYIFLCIVIMEKNTKTLKHTLQFVIGHRQCLKHFNSGPSSLIFEPLLDNPTKNKPLNWTKTSSTQQIG